MASLKITRAQLIAYKAEFDKKKMEEEAERQRVEEERVSRIIADECDVIIAAAVEAAKEGKSRYEHKLIRYNDQEKFSLGYRIVKALEKLTDAKVGYSYGVDVHMCSLKWD